MELAYLCPRCLSEPTMRECLSQHQGGKPDTVSELWNTAFSESDIFYLDTEIWQSFLYKQSVFDTSRWHKIFRNQ